jgi:two-component system, OmpR family, response regulator MprA
MLLFGLRTDHTGTMPTARTTVLIAEDDRAVRDSLQRALTLEGYEVVAVRDGQEALDYLESNTVDVVVLDIMMPTIDGLTACRRLRARRDPTPIIMVTARAETSDRVSGLDAGADDYLPKPYVLDELLARVRALARRFRADDTTGKQLVLGDLILDLSGRRCTRAGREIELSKTEFDLLELFIMNSGIVMDHSTIYERIWGYDFGPDSKNLAVYVGYLRRKTEEHAASRLIHTVRGVGYVARAGS